MEGGIYYAGRKVGECPRYIPEKDRYLFEKIKGEVEAKREWK